MQQLKAGRRSVHKVSSIVQALMVQVQGFSLRNTVRPTAGLRLPGSGGERSSYTELSQLQIIELGCSHRLIIISIWLLECLLVRCQVWASKQENTCPDEAREASTYGRVRLPNLRVESFLRSQQPRTKQDITIISQCSLDRYAMLSRHALQPKAGARHACTPWSLKRSNASSDVVQPTLMLG